MKKVLACSVVANLIAGIVLGHATIAIALVATVAGWVLNDAARCRRLIGIIAAMRATPCPDCRKR